ncbi:MAG: hypothetical protein IJB96_03225 [Lachnospira sp.]|nr:hypothetical protein [Lachnospira sp.]
MATESITKNFIVEGEEDVRMFAEAIEASIEFNMQQKKKGKKAEVSCRELKGDEIREFFEKRKAMYGHY